MSIRASFTKLRQLTSSKRRKGDPADKAKSSITQLADALGAGTADATSLRLPARYHVREKIGQGGMGVVYRVYDAVLGHEVALKSLSRLEPNEIYYLKNEFRGLVHIRHPNLIELYELYADGATCFFTMELVIGSHFVDHVRSTDQSSGCDWDKLLDASCQLAQALATVHAAGKLHRDIKPSNVMVTSTGRVVLLDFGLSAALPTADGRHAWDGLLVGTIDYMAPEQARAEQLTAAADWYSFGVMLYEAAAGRLPVKRSVHWFGQAGEPPAPLRQLVPDIPAHLDALVLRLLHPDRESRIAGTEVLQLLRGSRGSTSDAPASSRVRPGALPFEGRAGELEALDRAFAQLRNGRSSIVHLHGPSGIGKSELARRFVERTERSGALVLEGRCHPQESLAFNALDGMVDSLSHALERLTRNDVAIALPSNAAALPKLFPVLGRVEIIAREAAVKSDELAGETLRRAARALKLLLTELSARMPLVIWLDDIQWGDEDSGKLLREIVRGPDAPRMLLLLSYRTEDRASSRTLAALSRDGESDEASTDSVDLPLGGLSEHETLQLVRASVGFERFVDVELQRFAREAEGFPFFAHEIGRYLVDLPFDAVAASPDVNLDEMLCRRIASLPESAKRTLEIVSIAGGPLEEHLVTRATVVDLDISVHTVITSLEAQHLLRATDLGPERRTEIYHHRIRDVVIDRLSVSERRAHHRAIADAMLTAATPNLSQIVDHFDAANDSNAVRRYVAAAARQAAGAFAFDRAARLYQRAIDVGSIEVDVAALHERLGDALANAGRARAAGVAFERAASLAEQDAAPPEYLLSLRRRAADQYLKSWQQADAARALGVVVDPLGIAMPANRAAALRETLANRFVIALSPLTRSRVLRTAEPREADRFEVLRTLMQVYAMTDHVHGFAFGSRLLRHALRVGDPKFIQYGLACECASWSALIGDLPQRLAERHFRDLELLARDHGDEYHKSTVHTLAGEMLHFRGNFAQAIEHLQLGLGAVRDLRLMATVDLSVQLSFYLSELGFLGRLREQRSLLEQELQSAEARGDDYFVATCAAGHSTLAWILAGRGQEAAKWAARVLSVAPRGFSSQHYFHLVSSVWLDLYAGDGELAHARIERAWPSIRENHYLALSLIGDDLRLLRACAAVAAAATRGKRRSARLVRIALEEAKQIERHALPFAAGWAGAIRAGVFGVFGDRSAAIAALEVAAGVLEQTQMAFHAAACRYALGRLQPLAAGAADQAERWMLAEGIVDAGAATSLLIPGWSRLAQG